MSSWILLLMTITPRILIENFTRSTYRIHNQQCPAHMVHLNHTKGRPQNVDELAQLNKPIHQVSRTRNSNMTTENYCLTTHFFFSCVCMCARVRERERESAREQPASFWARLSNQSPHFKWIRSFKVCHLAHVACASSCMDLAKPQTVPTNSHGLFKSQYKSA